METELISVDSEDVQSEYSNVDLHVKRAEKFSKRKMINGKAEKEKHKTKTAKVVSNQVVTFVMSKQPTITANVVIFEKQRLIDYPYDCIPAIIEKMKECSMRFLCYDEPSSNMKTLISIIDSDGNELVTIEPFGKRFCVNRGQKDESSSDWEFRKTFGCCLLNDRIVFYHDKSSLDWEVFLAITLPKDNTYRLQITNICSSLHFLSETASFLEKLRVQCLPIGAEIGKSLYLERSAKFALSEQFVVGKSKLSLIDIRNQYFKIFNKTKPYCEWAKRIFRKDIELVDKANWCFTKPNVSKSFLLKVVLPCDRNEYFAKTGEIVWAICGIMMASHIDAPKTQTDRRTIAVLLLENPINPGWTHLRVGDPIVCLCDEDPDIRPIGLPNPTFYPYFGDILHSTAETKK